MIASSFCHCSIDPLCSALFFHTFRMHLVLCVSVCLCWLRRTKWNIYLLFILPLITINILSGDKLSPSVRLAFIHNEYVCLFSTTWERKNIWKKKKRIWLLWMCLPPLANLAKHNDKEELHINKSVQNSDSIHGCNRKRQKPKRNKSSCISLMLTGAYKLKMCDNLLIIYCLRFDRRANENEYENKKRIWKWKFTQSIFQMSFEQSFGTICQSIKFKIHIMLPDLIAERQTVSMHFVIIIAAHSGKIHLIWK